MVYVLLIILYGNTPTTGSNAINASIQFTDSKVCEARKAEIAAELKRVSVGNTIMCIEALRGGGK